MNDSKKSPARRKKGFERTSGLVSARVREASESRGFSEARILTHWEEIVGQSTAAMSRPVKVSYAKGGFGATLTLLTTGAYAPMLQAELPKLREKVNAVYGFNAIARIHITQTAPSGFAEGQAVFARAQKTKSKAAPDEGILREADALSKGVENENLRAALTRLATNFLSNQADQN